MDVPAARRLDLVEVLHGREVADPYRWLEDADRRRDAGVVGRPGPAGAGPPRRAARPRAASPGAWSELLATGAVGTPAWRGGRPFWTRRATRAGPRGPAHARRRRHRAGAARPGRGRPVRAHDARRLVAVEGGDAAGLPAVDRRRRGVAAARPRRRDRRAARRPGRPLPLLPRRLGPRRRRLLLRPPAAAGEVPAGEEAFHRRVLAPRRRDADRAGRPRLGRGARPDELLRLLGLAGRPVAARDGERRHGAARGRLAVRPRRRRPARRGAGRRRRPLLAVGVARRRPVAAHRPRRPPRPAVPGRPGVAAGLDDRRARGPRGRPRGRRAARRRGAAPLLRSRHALSEVHLRARRRRARRPPARPPAP